MPSFQAGAPGTRPGSASGNPQLGAGPMTQVSPCPGPSTGTRALGPGEGGEDFRMNFPSGRLSASGTTLAAQLRQLNAGASWLQITARRCRGGFSAVSLERGGGCRPRDRHRQRAGGEGRRSGEAGCGRTRGDVRDQKDSGMHVRTWEPPAGRPR